MKKMLPYISLALLFLGGCATQLKLPSNLQHATITPLTCTMLRASGCTYQIKPGNPSPDIHACLPDIQQASIVIGNIRDNLGRTIQRDAAFIGLMGSDVVIAFRGTETPYNANIETVIDDWRNDANAQPVNDPQLGTVHSGFLSTLNNLWPAILNKLTELKNSGKLDHARIFVTGHSKGGSVAQLASVRLKYSGFNAHGIYTYAAARSGAADFASKFEQLPSWRFENQGDLVPHLPASKEELKILRALHNEFGRLNGDGVYRSAGRLQFITDGLEVYDVPPTEEAQVDKDRLKWLEVAALDATLKGKLLHDLAANHDWSPPKPDDGGTHRYWRAACGSQ